MSDDHIEKHPEDKPWTAPAAADLAALSPLGRWLESGRAPRPAAAWKKFFYLLLALLALANLFLRPSEPHFGLDARFLFWPVFGLTVGAVMVFLVKKVIQPYFLKRPEDYYGDL